MRPCSQPPHFSTARPVSTGPRIKDTPLTDAQREVLEELESLAFRVSNNDSSPEDRLSDLAKCFETANGFKDKSHPKFLDIATLLARATATYSNATSFPKQQRHFQDIQYRLPIFNRSFAIHGNYKFAMQPPTLGLMVGELLAVRLRADGPGRGEAAICMATAVVQHLCSFAPDERAVSDLAESVVEAALAHNPTAEIMNACTEMVDKIPDREVRGEFSSAVAHACIDEIERPSWRHPEDKAPIGPYVMALGNAMRVLGPLEDHGAGAKIRLGDLFVKTAAKAVAGLERGSNYDYRSEWELVAGVFDYPCVPAERKSEVAKQFADSFLRSEDTWQHLLKSPVWHSDRPRFEALLGSTPHLPRSAVAPVAAALIKGCTQARELVLLSRAVRSFANEPGLEETQKQLIGYLLRFARSDRVDTLRCYREVMHISQETHLDVLQRLLNIDFDSLQEEHLDQVAVMSFQADPDGRAFRPGSEVRDTGLGSQNKDFILKGEPFVYPQCLASRRMLLRSTAAAHAAARVFNENTPAYVRVQADITTGYLGTSVQPSDWPILLNVLRSKREQLATSGGWLSVRRH
jgi:hypothetical protein